MPLPKTASIAARATDVYSEVCPLIMCSIGKKEFPEEVHQLLPYLRQLLTCCACAGLIKDAMVALMCGHCYCFMCQYGEPLMKIHCRQCRQREGLVINSQLRVVVQLYTQLVSIISEKSSLHREITPILRELITEVIEGTKVSREIFLVLPPQRYRITKLAKPPKTSSLLKQKAKLSNKILKRQLKHKMPLFVTTPPTLISSSVKHDSDEETLIEDANELEVTSESFVEPYTCDRSSHFVAISKVRPYQVLPRLPLSGLHKRTCSPFSPRLTSLRNSRKPSKILKLATPNLVVTTPTLHSTAIVVEPYHIVSSDAAGSICSSTDVSVQSTSQGGLATASNQSATTGIPSLSKKKKKFKRKSYICTLSREEIEALKQQPRYCCRCGTNPGVLFGHLICVKKKCPCFYNEMPCFRCRCKGCCNPYNYALNC